MTDRSLSDSIRGPLVPFASPAALRWHAAIAASAACAAVLANVILSPSRLWSPWLALAMGAALAAHGGLVLARALASAAPAVAPATGDGVAAADRLAEPAPRIDPGPPIFPDDPVMARPRRWIPRQPDGPAPVSRIAVLDGARIHPLPAPRSADTHVAMDMDPIALRPTPAWPSWEPRAVPARAAADDRWQSGAGYHPEPPGGPESAAAGW